MKTDSEEYEIEQVRIRRYGACDRHKGHATDSIVITIVNTIVITTFLVAGIFVWFDQTEELKAEAIKRGYAIYSQTTGKWQWR